MWKYLTVPQGKKIPYRSLVVLRICVLDRNHSARFEHISERQICEEKSVEIEINHIDIGRLSPERPVVNSKTPATRMYLSKN